MKKFFTYPVFLVIFLSIICSILFGALVKYHFDGGRKYQSLQKTAMFFASIPINIKKMIELKTINLDKVPPVRKHKDKKKFKQFIPNKRLGLLVLPRYDNHLSRSVVDIVDLNNFKVIHTYKHNISEMNEQVKNTEIFPRININNDSIRFLYQHPLIFEDGSLIGLNDLSPPFKIDFCSNLKWINDEKSFHHSMMLDHEGNIWVGGILNPPSKYVVKFGIGDEHFVDDAIIKMNTYGKIIYKKSVIEILIENKILPDNFVFSSFLSKKSDPIHLNDIEPAFSDTQYWKKGDVFLSIRSQSAIIHYRSSTNKVINYITGPFSMQHDVDIISEKEISIFNNNNSFNDNKYSEVLIYNFETNKIKKLFNDQLQSENFKTYSQGLSQILNDGALMVEEQNHGRIILFNKNGQKEWEFVNKDINGDIGVVNWSRIIEDELFINKYKLLVENKKCIN